MRPPLVPRPTLAVTPLSGTKLPSTWVAPPAVLLNVGSVLKTLSSRILPHWVQHLLGKAGERGERKVGGVHNYARGHLGIAARFGRAWEYSGMFGLT